MAAGGLAIQELLLIFLAIGTAGVGLLSLLGWLGGVWWVLDIASHFRLQYGVILIVAGVLAWWLGSPVLGLIAALLAFSNLIVVIPLYWLPGQALAATGQSPVRRVLFANLWQPNQSHADVLHLVEQNNPDLILLVESNQRWLDELEPLRQAYPFWVVQPREDNYGVALLSCHPVLEREVCAFSAAGVPSIVAQVDLDGRAITVVCTHPPPPKSHAEMRARDQQMANLANLAALRTRPMLVCGDLNLTPWSPVFWRFTRRGGLSDSARGFGFQATWPVGKPTMDVLLGVLLGVPIDHCLVSPEITVLDRRLGPAVGSDHYPLIVDFIIA
jgi:endonuclease/exonuclease/phosphatase (EEP) superfamily protein YafD